mgnify:CR=1 FL=1
MKQFLLASHGKFAEGILGSFQMILGDAPNITVLCAYTKENEETLEHTVKKIICERNRKEDLIVVTDVFGGSVNNEFMKYLNEPGVYLEGKFGIRLENLLLCVEKEQNEFGQFLGFEALTLAPFERDAIDPSQMTQQDKQLLNEYHEKVYDTISPYLDRNEAEWLMDACAPID